MHSHTHVRTHARTHTHTHMHSHTHTLRPHHVPTAPFPPGSLTSPHLSDSEQLQILYNLTEPQVIQTTGSWDREFDSFGSNRNASAAQLTTFLRGALLNDGNFTELFNSRSENDYTSGMWDGDVTLVVHVTGLTLPAVFKVGGVCVCVRVRACA